MVQDLGAADGSVDLAPEGPAVGWGVLSDEDVSKDRGSRQCDTLADSGKIADRRGRCSDDHHTVGHRREIGCLRGRGNRRGIDQDEVVVGCDTRECFRECRCAEVAADVVMAHAASGNDRKGCTVIGRRLVNNFLRTSSVLQVGDSRFRLESGELG